MDNMPNWAFRLTKPDGILFLKQDHRIKIIIPEVAVEDPRGQFALERVGVYQVGREQFNCFSRAFGRDIRQHVNGAGFGPAVDPRTIHVDNVGDPFRHAELLLREAETETV